MPTGTQFQQPNGSAAAGIINGLLTTPRPGGLGGISGAIMGGQQAPVDQFGNPMPQGVPGQPIQAQAPGQAPGQNPGQSIGGGLAGVASKLEQEGIKRYKDRKLYNEWEFVYDITKDPARTGGLPQPPGAQQQQQQAQPGQLPVQPFMPQQPAPNQPPPPPPPAPQ